MVENVDSKYIKLLLNDNKIFESAELFYAKNCLPKCIETVDGIHIPLKKPRDRVSDYINRKGNYSFDSQAVSDSK